MACCFIEVCAGSSDPLSRFEASRPHRPRRSHHPFSDPPGNTAPAFSKPRSFPPPATTIHERFGSEDGDPMSAGGISSAWETEEAVRVPPPGGRRRQLQDRAAGGRRSRHDRTGRGGDERPGRRPAHTGWLGDFGPVHTHTVREVAGDDEDDDDDDGGGGDCAEEEEEEEEDGVDGGSSSAGGGGGGGTALVAARGSRGSRPDRVIWVLKSGEVAKLEGMDVSRNLKIRVGFAPADGSSSCRSVRMSLRPSFSRYMVDRDRGEGREARSASGGG